MKSLRAKILLGNGLVLLLVATVLVWLFLNQRILSENYGSIMVVENMIYAIERQHSALLLFLLGYRQEAVEQFTNHESQVMMESNIFEMFVQAKSDLLKGGTDLELNICREMVRAYGARSGWTPNPKGEVCSLSPSL